MGPALACVAAGTLVVLLRRPRARAIRRSQEFVFDRALDEDGLTWWVAAIGSLVAALGLVFLGITLLG